MNKKTLHDFCLTIQGATHDYQPDWQADRYFIGGKMFALMGEKPMIILKCDPIRAEELREQYEGITAGYHMNKTHWNSIYFNSDVDEQMAHALIQHSCELVLNKLPKKVQKQINEQ